MFPMPSLHTLTHSIQQNDHALCRRTLTVAIAQWVYFLFAFPLAVAAIKNCISRENFQDQSLLDRKKSYEN